MDSTEPTPPMMADSRENREGGDQDLATGTITELDARPFAAAVGVAAASGGDDSRWWEIEKEDFILDQVPNVTSVFTECEESKSVLTEDGDHLRKADGNHCNKVSTSESEIRNVENVNKSSESNCTETDCPKYTERIKKLSVRSREQSLEEFKEELRQKRLARQNAVKELRAEVATLRKQLAIERDVTRRLRSGESVTNSTESTEIEPASKANEGPLDSQTIKGESITVDADDVDPMSRGRHANIELANAQLALQMANSENISLRTELGVVQKQVGTLKEVIACCKQMLALKEEQCSQLKSKLSEIESSFAEHEMKIMSDNLRQEYEKQLANIRQLRQLYEERQRISAAEYENLQRLISIKKDELSAEQEKTNKLEGRIKTLVNEIEYASNEVACLRDECREHKFEKSALKEELGAVNTLFSQMVMGFNGQNNLDIDRLTTMLEENRTLLSDMATKELDCGDGATLPKLLLELVEQAAVSVGSSGKTSPPATPTFMGLESDKEHATTNEDVRTKVETDSGEANNENTASNASNEEDRREEVVKQQQQPETADESDIRCSGERVNDFANKINKKQHRRNTNNKKMLPPLSASETEGAAALAPSPSSSSSSPPSPSPSSSSSAGRILKFQASDVIGKVSSTQEIIGNLPKVWKVLMELLSHHKIEQVQFEENGKGEDCYKSVETPNGPKAELSVSKTYLKLKDLILEKKSLVKETNRLKTLNGHLEYRLNEQEKRLSAVSRELTKTWHLVGKMQRQHRQLHTQEQILRYQLQQKRRLLSELKEELEYCRRKWAAARAKNDESQEQYDDLRREFAKRKLEDANNSAESGYSDSGGPGSDEETVVGAVAVGAAASSMSAAAGVGNGRRRYSKDMFEHTRKIKRMQSTSPGRAANAAATEMVVLRWNSAPPTCGWRNGEADGEDDDIEEVEPTVLVRPSTSRGAIPKTSARSSRLFKRTGSGGEEEEEEGDDGQSTVGQTAQREERASRILRLEEQCKSLIKQVLETSDNRERLEVQLCRFQDEIAPVQYAVPLDDLIRMKRVERMTRASSVPLSGSLTPREEEYTRKRSERLGRLEEESRQLMARIKRTSDRGHYLRCSLDRIRRAPSRDESFESNTEEEVRNDDKQPLPPASTDGPSATGNDSDDAATAPEQSVGKSPLTAEEEAYTVRRSARLQRLEEEGKELMTKLSRNTEKGTDLENKLDTLHERYAAEGDDVRSNSKPTEPSNSKLSSGDSDNSVEERIRNIEKISSNREERLRLLEEEGKQLISRLSQTSERGTRMINRITRRELCRQARLQGTPSREVDDAQAAPDESLPQGRSERENTSDKGDASPADGLRKDSNENLDTNGATGCDDTPVASEIMPTPKNVACSSIVSEELTERVTITTTPSQIAAQQGAIPKSKPVAQLSVAQPKATKRVNSANKTNDNDNDNETLEEMVKRLKSLPFPQPVEAMKPSPSKQEDEEQKEPKEEKEQKEQKEEKDPE